MTKFPHVSVRYGSIFKTAQPNSDEQAVRDTIRKARSKRAPRMPSFNLPPLEDEPAEPPGVQPQREPRRTGRPTRWS